MAQKAPTRLAIDELLLAGNVPASDFAVWLQTYHIPPTTGPDAPALMLVEEQPRRVITQDSRQKLLHFAFFDLAFDFTLYTSGRIFHELGELRWERQHTIIQIVYTGHIAYMPNLQDARETTLKTCRPTDRAYFLFGKRLDQQQLDRIGPAAQPGDFAEVRIPRLLRYPQIPTGADAERLQLVVCEYVENTTGTNIAYRFKSIIPFEQQQEQKNV